MNRLLLFCCFTLLLPCGPARADVRLPRLVGDGMVLQRDKVITLWGWANPHEAVSVSFAGQRVATQTPESGRWQVTLRPVGAGGPHQLTIQGKNRLVLRDVLVGDVWLCSGQSNMDWMVKNAANGQQEITNAQYPAIRLFQVPHRMATTPADSLTGGAWQPCSPSIVGRFSAVAYFFGRDLHRHLGVPIGLIQSSWGGTKIETWMSASAIGPVGTYAQEIADLPSLALDSLHREGEERDRRWKAGLLAYDQGMQDGEARWAQPDTDTSAWEPIQQPGYWEYAGFGKLDGVVWLRKTFVLPPEVARRGITLHLGPIYHADRTYVNGQKAGETVGEEKRWQPRIYAVPPANLKVGSNVLTVRVENYGGKGGLYGKPEELYIDAAGYRQPLGGAWKLRSSTQNLPPRPRRISPNSKPTLLFNGMIHPLLPYVMKGIIWYQGESNTGNASGYRVLFPRLIQDWRQRWQDDLPFLFVQLAGFGPPHDQPQESEWAALRDAQASTLSVPGTGMAVTTDIGDAYSIHPLNKQDVGKRLARVARRVAYGEEVVSSGPVYDTMQVEGNQIRIYFRNAGQRLRGNNGNVAGGFSVAGADQTFSPAHARIDGATVLVWSDAVKNPVAVRYGWADNPTGANLCNQEGLPARPFRTDDWPLK